VSWLAERPDRGRNLPDDESLVGLPDLLGVLNVQGGPRAREVVETVAHGVLRWIRTARAAGTGWIDHDATDLDRFGLPSEADVFKSALLHRILGDPEAGIAPKDPLPEPPPTSYSYPWYELMDVGHARAVGVEPWRLDWMPELKGLSVNESGFSIVEQPEPETWLLRSMRRVSGDDNPNADVHGWVLSSSIFEVRLDPVEQVLSSNGDSEGLSDTHAPIEHEGGQSVVYVPRGVTGTIRVVE
jgi:hypothetical protein